MISETDITIIFGQRGSGKSTLSRRISEIYPRRIVFDRLHEWSDASFVIVRNFDDFHKAWTLLHQNERFTIVYQSDIEQRNEEQQATFNAIIKTVYKTEKILQIGTALVFEEIHFYADPHFCEPWLFEAVLTGRHAKLAIVGNSQRPASVHKSVISQAANVFIGQLFERRDLKYLSECVGEVAFQAATLRKFSFLLYRVGESPRIVN